MSTLSTSDSEELIRLFEHSDWQELALRTGDCELLLSKNRDSGASWNANGTCTTFPDAAAARLQPSAHVVPLEPSGVGQEPAQPSESSRGGNRMLPARSVVTAPSLGTFYRAPKSGAAAFVEVDQQVDKGAELCLIEVMKRCTTLCAGVAGTVREIYAKEGDLVEFAQPLFLIDTHE